jgi:hypothetical protein
MVTERWLQSVSHISTPVPGLTLRIARLDVTLELIGRSGAAAATGASPGPGRMAAFGLHDVH